MRHYDLEASCLETFLSKSFIVFSWTKQNKSTFLLAQEGEKKEKEASSQRSIAESWSVCARG